MFDRKSIAKCENKIKMMEDYLDARIETYQSEIALNLKLLAIDNEEVKVRATKEIEKNQSVLHALKYLKRKYDELFN